MGLNWTPERDEQLTLLYGQNISYTKIAEELGNTSKNACIARARRIGLAARRTTYGPRTAIQRIHFGSSRPRIENDTEPKPVPEVTVISFLDLSADNCHFPLEGDDSPATVFCGSLAVEGKPYCKAHMALCYVKPRKGDIARLANVV